MKTVSFISNYNPSYVIGYLSNVIGSGKIITFKRLGNSTYSYVISLEKDKNIECLKI